MAVKAVNCHNCHMAVGTIISQWKFSAEVNYLNCRTAVEAVNCHNCRTAVEAVEAVGGCVGGGKRTIYKVRVLNLVEELKDLIKGNERCYENFKEKGGGGNI